MGHGKGEKCDDCGTAAVELRKTEPSGTEVWICAACGDIRRRCPVCDEGWVQLLRAPSNGLELYVCEECESSWEEASEIREDRAEPLHDYLETARRADSYFELEVVRENDRPEEEDDAA